LALLVISVTINYNDRTNLSLSASRLSSELHLAPGQIGLLLSSFFWTYAAMQIVAGWLIDRYSVYWIFAGGFFIWSAATALTGLAGGFATIFALRLVLGVGESVAYPAYSKIIALNYSEDHRGLANSVVAAGLSLGPGFGMLLGGTLMARFGWRPFFIVLGLASLLWLPPWIKWMPRTTVVPPSDATAAPSLWEAS